jgi:hypothetical protein
MRSAYLLWVAIAVLLVGGVTQAQMFDITNPGDPVLGVPNNNNWPPAESPPNAIDNVVATKYLCFETSFVPDAATGGSGFRVTPSGPKVVIKALNFASANDEAPRDPVAFRLSGSDESINGPYTVIAVGTIDDFDRATAWARLTWISAPVPIVSKKAYLHYELFFTDIRDRAPANSMQIAEVELLSDGSLAGSAGGPVPADKATDVPRDALLAWIAGEMAATHDVYFGTTLADVNNAARADTTGILVSKDQTATTFDPPGSLAYGQTYYWRIDEVNAAPDYTVFKGDVWSFTAEPYGYPITGVTATASSSAANMGPEKTVDGSGLTGDLHGTDGTTMWLSGGVQPNWIQYQFDKAYKLNDLKVWNSNQLIESFLGFGARKVTIETSTEPAPAQAGGTTWTPLANVPEFAKAPGLAGYAANTTVSFGGVMAKYVKLTINGNWGGMAPQTGLSEVRFSYVPVQARVPQPATAATGVAIDASLNWRPGREAASHKVFFGADPNAVANGTAPAKTVTDHGYTPDSLNLGTSYYWRVDEVNTVTYPGDVWSFTTETSKVVDDFESYSDKTGKEVYSTWIDGLADNYKSSGSTVGLDTAVGGTYCSTTIFRGGKQSMPLAYDNTKGPGFSEAVRTFDTAQNWTANGIKSLSLWFQGTAGNTGQLYMKINGTKVSYNGAAGDLAKSMWTPWNIDLSTTGANLSKITSLTIGIEGAGAQGTLYIDDIRLYPKTPAYLTPVDPGKTNLVALWALDGNANDTSGKGNNGTVTAGTAQWVPGMVNQALQFNGGPMYVDCGNGASLKLTDAVTISAWIKMDFTAGDRKIAGNQDGVAGGYKFGLYTNNKVEFEVRTGATGTLNRNTAGGTVLQQGVWYHVAGVYSKGQFIRTYVFGNLDRELLTTGVLGPTAGSFKLGRGESATTYFWLGALDEVQVYSKALSQEELLWLSGQKTPVAKPF